MQVARPIIAVRLEDIRHVQPRPAGSQETRAGTDKCPSDLLLGLPLALKGTPISLELSTNRCFPGLRRHHTEASTPDGALLLCSNFCTAAGETSMTEPFSGEHWVGTVGAFKAVCERAKENDYNGDCFEHLRAEPRRLVVRLVHLLLDEDVLRVDWPLALPGKLQRCLLCDGLQGEASAQRTLRSDGEDNAVTSQPKKRRTRSRTMLSNRNCQGVRRRRPAESQPTSPAQGEQALRPSPSKERHHPPHSSRPRSVSGRLRA